MNHFECSKLSNVSVNFAAAIFVLNVATAILVEKFEKFQNSKRFIPDIESCVLHLYYLTVLH
jgi:hypothetical protein